MYVIQEEDEDNFSDRSSIRKDRSSIMKLESSVHNLEGKNLLDPLQEVEGEEENQQDFLVPQ
jgi:hypothetical protein